MKRDLIWIVARIEDHTVCKNCEKVYYYRVSKVVYSNELNNLSGCKRRGGLFRRREYLREARTIYFQLEIHRRQLLALENRSSWEILAFRSKCSAGTARTHGTDVFEKPNNAKINRRGGCATV